MSFALIAPSIFPLIFLLVRLPPAGISRHAQRQFDIFVVPSPIRELVPRTSSLSWMSSLNLPIGYNGLFMNLIAPPITPCCGCTIELMLRAPPLSGLLPRPLLMTIHSSITNMCFWCTCTCDMSLFFGLLLIHMLC
jgi:hypothetical protein